MQEDLLARAERIRVAALDNVDSKNLDMLGQFFTPAQAASLIASMPELPAQGEIKVLDPGAGSGMLSAALVARVIDQCPELVVRVVAVECDEAMLPYLEDTLKACVSAGSGRINYDIVSADYISASTGIDRDDRTSGFDIVIQNPPYAKLGSSSRARAAVRSTGTDAPNLYAAFLALATDALHPGGQLVAITPRSFCNGPYFGEFRSDLLDRIALDRVHVFESRSTVFADTGVLQENIIISGTKHGSRTRVALSASDDHEDDGASRRVAYEDVVHADDPHKFIRIMSKDEDTAIAEQMLSMPSDLGSAGAAVSTGRIVDFRVRDCLLARSDDHAAPLVYPVNLRAGVVVWPVETKKAQWFRPRSSTDQKLLLPEGWYCVVKRFSAKEERRRIVAAVWSPEQTPGPIAFENHLNVFHDGGGGLERDIAFGMSMWLNSSLVDKYFRTFSGHTQVNATDLRSLRFPDVAVLRRLGSLAPEQLPEQVEIDRLVDRALDVVNKAA